MDKNSISFCIAHPAMDPQEITDNVGIEPDISQGAGLPIISPQGQVIGGEYKHTKWCIRECEINDGDILDRLVALISFLDRRKAFFDALSKDGGEFSIFLNISKPSKVRLMIPTDSINKMAQLKIAFGFEIFN